jgi:hypothetical protein
MLTTTIAAANMSAISVQQAAIATFIAISPAGEIISGNF